MTNLPNLGDHPDGKGMGTTLRRTINSNSRDRLLDNSKNRSVDVNCTTGDPIILDLEEQYANYFIRLTGSPTGAFTLQFADSNLRRVVQNVSGQTATIDTATGATPTISLLTATTKKIQIRGIELITTGIP